MNGLISRMAISIDNLDGLDALDAPAPASDTPAPAPADTAAATITPSNIIWGDQGQPAAACDSFFVTLDDSVQVTVWNSNAQLTSLPVQLRILKPDGTLSITGGTIQNLSSNRTANVLILGELEGLIMGVVIGPPGVTVRRGQCYVQVAIIRGVTGNLLFFQALCSDYLSSSFLPCWPTGRVLSPTEDRGLVAAYTGVGPPAGNPASINQPQVTRWRVMSASVSLVTDAAVGNRQVSLSISSGGVSVYTIDAPVTQPPSSNYLYVFAPIGSAVAAPPAVNVSPTPADFFVNNTAGFLFQATGMDAADQFGIPRVQVEEWIDL